MSGEPSSTPPATAFGRHRYDVFLSFRGEDTRSNFTDHLYHGLKDAGIHTYRDDNELRRGQDIASELIGAIRGSRIVVVVFSRNYGDSRWCLQELVEIVECRRAKGQYVIPVFYHVNPSDVRNQRGSYADAFDEHERRFVTEEGRSDVLKWRAALKEAASLSGWHVTSDQVTPKYIDTQQGDRLIEGYLLDQTEAKDPMLALLHRLRHEAEVVRGIASQVSNELKQTLLSVPQFIVGIDSRLPDMIKHMNLSNNNDRVLFIGICGMGGIGKTILAKILFNQFFGNFGGKSFLADIRENSKQPNGIVHLQEQLLSDVLKLGENASPNIGVIDMGINVIKQRLCNTSVLIVLDDVDDRKQIEALAGDRDWFSPGSRVLITTRNPDLLNVDTIYTVKGLDEDESTLLFNHHCNNNAREKEEEFNDISKDIIHYCKGLPFALEKIGSVLRNRRIEEWNDVFAKLKIAPPVELQKKLKISFDALVDDNDKEVFLDIACFFVGWDKDDAVCALNGCGLSAEIAISVLVKRSLVTINAENNKVLMHDLIRDMGREIVRSECPKNPGNRTRLWAYQDILKTLQDNLGTERVGGIVQSSPGLHEVTVSAEAFAKMKQLRLLCLDNVRVHGNYGLLPSELSWLRWRKFPLESIPANFDMRNLVSIDMQHSKLRVTWRSMKVMNKLKILDLSHSHSLIKTPDFSNLPSLEKLILEDCKELTYIHETIGGLQRLGVVNLKDCGKLRRIPSCLCSVPSLRVLDISGCVSIEKLAEEDFRRLTESLTEFRGYNQSSLSNSRSVTKIGLKMGIFSIVEWLGVYFRRKEVIQPQLRLTAKPKRVIDDVEADPSSYPPDAKRQRQK